jgi:hypothetical protein
VRFISALLLLSVVFSAETCQPQSKPNARVSLQLDSVTVWLGMPQTEVIKDFSDAGDEVRDFNEESLCPGCKCGTVLVLSREHGTFDLRFDKARLVFASVLRSKVHNIEEADALLVALGELTDTDTSQPCSLSHTPLRHVQFLQFDVALSTATISCGEKSVVIASYKYLGKPTVIEVVEQIGQIPGD